MTDPLSIAASIIGIAAAGAKVSISLYQLSDEVGSAAKDARRMGNEISSFCAVLRMLGMTLEEADALSVLRCKDVAEEMSARCLTIFIEIIELVRELQGYICAPGEHGSKWTKRIGWVLQKPRIAYLRGCLESYKSTLNLMLATLELARQVEKRRQVQTLTPLWLLLTRTRSSKIRGVEHESEKHRQSLIHSLELANRASIAELEELEEKASTKREEPLFKEEPSSESLEPPKTGGERTENLGGSRKSFRSDDNSFFIDSLHKELESFRTGGANTTSVNTIEGYSVSRTSWTSTRNSFWLSEEQRNLRRWSSQLLHTPDEPPRRRISQLSLDSRRSRRMTQVYDGIVQAPPFPVINEGEETGTGPGTLSEIRHHAQDDCTTHPGSPPNLSLFNQDFSKVTRAIKHWLDDLPAEDCAKAWRSLLPAGYMVWYLSEHSSSSQLRGPGNYSRQLSQPAELAHCSKI